VASSRRKLPLRSESFGIAGRRRVGETTNGMKHGAGVHHSFRNRPRDWVHSRIWRSERGGGFAKPMLKRRRQYSSASMIVITRLVTDGSAGSGEW
jgi:hypothetical protein